MTSAEYICTRVGYSIGISSVSFTCTWFFDSIKALLPLNLWVLPRVLYGVYCYILDITRFITQLRMDGTNLISTLPKSKGKVYITEKEKKGKE